MVVRHEACILAYTQLHYSRLKNNLSPPATPPRNDTFHFSFKFWRTRADHSKILPSPLLFYISLSSMLHEPSLGRRQTQQGRNWWGNGCAAPLASHPNVPQRVLPIPCGRPPPLHKSPSEAPCSVCQCTLGTVFFF